MGSGTGGGVPLLWEGGLAAREAQGGVAGGVIIGLRLSEVVEERVEVEVELGEVEKEKEEGRPNPPIPFLLKGRGRAWGGTLSC